MKAELDWSQVPVSDPDLIMRKQVDWSLLKSGWTIPVTMHDRVVHENGGDKLSPGDKRYITLIVNGRPFGAVLTCTSRKQDQTSFLQIRYDKNRKLRRLLANVFWTSWSSLEAERARLSEGNSSQRRIFAEVPATSAEFVEWKSVGIPFCYQLDLAPCRIRASERTLSILTRLGERQVESIITMTSQDEFAYMLSALERLTGPDDVKIVEYLRCSRTYMALATGLLSRLYGGVCQVCNDRIGNPAPKKIGQLHYIDAFTVATDNRVSNLVMLCPTHHEIVHTTNARFDRDRMEFAVMEASVLPIVVDYHL